MFIVYDKDNNIYYARLVKDNKSQLRRIREEDALDLKKLGVKIFVSDSSFTKEYIKYNRIESEVSK